jgi:hypothetical protein
MNRTGHAMVMEVSDAVCSNHMGECCLRNSIETSQECCVLAVGRLTTCIDYFQRRYSQ